MRLKLDIPNDSGNNEIEFNNALFILGANGSGKTNLGAFLEKKKEFFTLFNDESISIESKTIHRITAQKVIQFPISISVGDKDERALFNLLINGAEKSEIQDHTLQYKYKSLGSSQPYDDEMR